MPSSSSEQLSYFIPFLFQEWHTKVENYVIENTKCIQLNKIFSLSENWIQFNSLEMELWLNHDLATHIYSFNSATTVWKMRCFYNTLGKQCSFTFTNFCVSAIGTRLVNWFNNSILFIGSVRQTIKSTIHAYYWPINWSIVYVK